MFDRCKTLIVNHEEAFVQTYDLVLRAGELVALLIVDNARPVVVLNPVNVNGVA